MNIKLLLLHHFICQEKSKELGDPSANIDNTITKHKEYLRNMWKTINENDEDNDNNNNGNNDVNIDTWAKVNLTPSSDKSKNHKGHNENKNENPENAKGTKKPFYSNSNIISEIKQELPSLVTNPKIDNSTHLIVPLKTFTYWQKHLQRTCTKLNIYDPLSDKNFNVNMFKHMLVDDKHKVSRKLT